ncbi:MAG: NAD(P)-dependent oxidoreductase [Ignavibacteriales bacterium]|nr:NAD(P)-dependent oxidoreductase [Ignavibacteriales bacterium]
MRLGLIGTGLMGKPMAEKLIEAEYDLKIYNRTAGKAESLINIGAKAFTDVNELANNSDVIIMMLSNYDAIQEVLFESNISQLENKTIIQMSTIAPTESLELKSRVEKLRGEYFEAPVLGSINQILDKELIVLVGSNEIQFAKYKKMFESFSKKIMYIGEVGKASAIKLALNQLIISETAAFSMSLGYVRENNLNIETFMDILRSSALYAQTFDKKLPNYLERNFENPNFPVKHLLKDLDLMLNEFADKNINTDTLKGIRKILVDSIKTGNSDKDYSAIYNSIHIKKD